MIGTLGQFFAERFRRWLPDSFIFAILLTFLATLLAIIFVGATPYAVVQSWWKGFWNLLAFAMQMVLILATGYALAISPPISRFLDWLSRIVKTPAAVYIVVTFMGCIFCTISWGWVVLTAVLARELALRVKGVDYRLISAACYIGVIPWHGGLSGSIPLLLNTPNNFLIKANILSETIPTTITLLGPMNIVVTIALIVLLPLLVYSMRPQGDDIEEFKDLAVEGAAGVKQMTVAEEAESLRLPVKNFSDMLNYSWVITVVICAGGVYYLVWHFSKNGFDVNLNIMNFLFIMLGMLFHKNPFRYVVAMKRACSNVSGIVLQFPFYAGIMGIMIHTGLGTAIATWIAGGATIGSYPFICFLVAGLVNIFVPSGGGEWAVVGPTIVEAAKTLGSGLTPDQLTHFIAKSAMAVGYGDAWTNMIQPFWTLAFMPVIAAGTKMQARDIMGFAFIGLIGSGIIFTICILFIPL